MIELSRLNKFYEKGKQNQVHAVNDISLTLPDAGMIALFGRSGCGKTTLLNIIGGLDKPDCGSVLVNGSPISPDDDRTRNLSVGYIFQNYNLSMQMTVYENVASALLLCGVRDKEAIRERVMAALKCVGMEKFEKRLPSALSGGQQQRVAIARAIVKKPAVILADEPTGNLDEQNTQKVMELLKDISREHLVILVTHESHLVEYYCDRIIELSDGRVVGEKENVALQNYLGRYSNEIYLGDMERSELTGDNIEIESYGSDADMGDKLKLRLIYSGGSIYICSTNGAKLKLADTASEIRIHEGKHEDKQKRESIELPEILEQPLPLDAKARPGKRYSFIEAVKSGSRANFGKKKKRKKLLISILLIFSMIFVFVVAGFGSVIYDLKTINSRYNSNVVYVKVNSVNAEQIKSLYDKELIDAHYYDFNYGYGNSGFSVTLEPIIGTFETINRGMAIANFSNVMLFSMPTQSDMTPLAGKAQPQAADDAVITRALADKMIEKMRVSFIKSYEDIIGTEVNVFVTMNVGGTKKIVGVVEGENAEIYIDRHEYVSRMFDGRGEFVGEYRGVGIFDAKRYDPDGKQAEPPTGSVYVSLPDTDSNANIPKSLIIDGKTFEVIGEVERRRETYQPEVIMNYQDMEELVFYPQLQGGDKLPQNSTNDIWNISLFSSYEKFNYYGDPQIIFYGDDTNAIENELVKFCSADSITSYDDLVKQDVASSKGSMMGLIISTVIMLSIISLCLYMLMRSATFSSIKEIGISRATGVSKKNIYFRYFVEMLVLFVLTGFIGYILAGMMVAPIAEEMLMLDIAMFYYPSWLAALTLLVIFADSIIFGLLPIHGILRKTPAEILAKYDI